MRTKYNIFDITKFILSFLVVAIHTKMTETGLTMKVICSLAVPLFFIMSGYLLEHNRRLPDWGGAKANRHETL